MQGNLAIVGANARAWLPLVILPATVLALGPAVASWAFMWMLAIAIFMGCKWLSWEMCEVQGASWSRHLEYLLAWPGMDATAFLATAPSDRKQRCLLSETRGALANCFAGAVLLWGVARLFVSTHDLIAGWIGMIGIVLILHFGVFRLLSCAWRAAGVAAPPLMDRPLAAVSVSEFWGKRWNTAFRDLTYRFLFRPMTSRCGAKTALVVGFFVSGLIHDVVISVPAQAGFGGPTLFFALQAGALLFERSTWGRACGLGKGWRGRLFTALALILPAPLLFHAPFIRAVALPFMQALGAL